MPEPSRNEDILKSIINGTEYTDPAQSREEALLIQLKDVIGPGGGGGTSDYSVLTNKPSINSVSLDGNKTSSDLGLVSAVSGKGLSTEDYTTAEKNKLSSITNPLVIKGRVDTTLSLPSDAEVGWVYFVGAASDTDLAEYVYSSDSRWEKIGAFNPETDLSDYYTKTETDNAFLLKTDAVGEKVLNGGEKFNNASTASGRYSHAEGDGTNATGQSSHAEGMDTTASIIGAHAEGISVTASGYSSHAEGMGVTASGYSSHAEGLRVTASGRSSHAEGTSTIASATNTHAEGVSTIAASQNQHVQGKYNVSDDTSKYAFIIGNGTGDAASARSNAFAIDWDGKVYTGNSGVGVDIEALSNSVKNIEVLSESEYEALPTKTADLYFIYEDAEEVETT